ncbi:hypothetical protein E8E13_005483 [Curvularia kusanoi]|uniref:Uncharacterized protein n=1 Tax=Curvularia kusanoi TaxID=90978 RepID=A0A9P4TIT5_CURKU|nr:hypothetical protein E8E13_005483 [Curvularia kusanoi]
MDACHKSILYTILGFKDAPKDSELRSIWGRALRCDFSSHREIHDLLSNVGSITSSKCVHLSIVFELGLKRGSQLRAFQDFFGIVYDMGSRDGTKAGDIVLRLPASMDFIQTMADEEGIHLFEPNNTGAWSCKFGPELEPQEVMEGLGMDWVYQR